MAPGQRREFVTAVELGRPTAVKDYRYLCGRRGAALANPLLPCFTQTLYPCDAGRSPQCPVPVFALPGHFLLSFPNRKCCSEGDLSSG